MKNWDSFYRRNQKPAPPPPKVWPYWDPPTQKELYDTMDYEQEVARRASINAVLSKVGRVGVFLLMLALAFAFVLAGRSCDAEQRQECRDRGGRVGEVHGGRGGWICIER